MGKLADKISSELRQTIRDEMEEFIDLVYDDLCRSISDDYPPASEPGEPPHRRTGSYVESIRKRVWVYATGKIDARVFTDDIRSMWFRTGTKHMAPRPHFEECFTRWEDEFKRRMERIAQRSRIRS